MGHARRVTHCGALRPGAEQQTKCRPHDELRANRGDSEFPQDSRGKPEAALSGFGAPAPPLPAPQSATYMTSACAGKETRYDPARIRARR
jgi:hypothetical protein